MKARSSPCVFRFSSGANHNGSGTLGITRNSNGLAGVAPAVDSTLRRKRALGPLGAHGSELLKVAVRKMAAVLIGLDGTQRGASLIVEDHAPPIRLGER